MSEFESGIFILSVLVGNFLDQQFLTVLWRKNLDIHPSIQIKMKPVQSVQFVRDWIHSLCLLEYSIIFILNKQRVPMINLQVLFCR